MSINKLIIISVLSLFYCGVERTGAQTVRATNYSAKVVSVLPHDINAYTQGLFFHDNRLFESSGQYGQSFFREVDLKTGNTVRSFNLPARYFAEGAVVLNDKLYILTWMENEVLVYDINSFRQIGQLRNPREGWGLTTDGNILIASDGSANLYFHDPITFRELSRVEVRLNGVALSQLNELEYIDGKVWANVFGTDNIAIIDPVSGEVTGMVDCRNLLPRSLRTAKTDVLNGIAYNPKDGSIYLTGKYWPRMFKIELVNK